jgi:hypothetical protein
MLSLLLLLLPPLACSEAEDEDAADVVVDCEGDDDDDEDVGGGLWSGEMAAATKLAMKKTSDIAIKTNRSILDLLLVALIGTQHLAKAVSNLFYELILPPCLIANDVRLAKLVPRQDIHCQGHHTKADRVR